MNWLRVLAVVFVSIPIVAIFASMLISSRQYHFDWAETLKAWASGIALTVLAIGFFLLFAIALVYALDGHL